MILEWKWTQESKKSVRVLPVCSCRHSPEWRAPEPHSTSWDAPRNRSSSILHGTRTTHTCPKKHWPEWRSECRLGTYKSSRSRLAPASGAWTKPQSSAIEIQQREPPHGIWLRNRPWDRDLGFQHRRTRFRVGFADLRVKGTEMGDMELDLERDSSSERWNWTEAKKADGISTKSFEDSDLRERKKTKWWEVYIELREYSWNLKKLNK